MFSVLVVAFLMAVGKSDAIQIDINYSADPSLKNFADKVHSTLIQWYPTLEAKLKSPTFKPIEYVSITFDSNYNGVAYAAGNRIVGSVKYYRDHQDDVGSMVHELVHVIQGYKNGPGWVVEGIADYVRYFIFEPNRKPGKPGSNNKYTDGYGVTAWFLDYIVRTNNFTPDFVYWLNKDCREGTYNDYIWEKLLKKTVDQLWNEMMTAPAIKIEVDYSAAPELRNFAENIRATLTAWYPWFAEALESPTFVPIPYIKVTFDPKYDGVAYASGNQIVGGVKYYKTHQDDLGSMIHEMIHVIQGYKNCPGWLTEGIADYWRYYHYEDVKKPKPTKPGVNNNYTDGYDKVAYFIDYTQRTYGDLLYWLNKDCREGKYTDNIWSGMLAGRSLD
ncbi:unnamed protein product, partial [Allacma fusca]